MSNSEGLQTMKDVNFVGTVLGSNRGLATNVISRGILKQWHDD